MNVFVTPLKVMNDSLISELFLYDEDVLEKVNDSFLYVKVVELCNHSLLILQVFLILINECVPLINDTADVIKD